MSLPSFPYSKKYVRKHSTETNGLPEGALDKILDDIYGPRYQFLSDSQLERISEANYFYSYYDLEGQEWDAPAALGYEPTVLTVNLARWFVKKRVAWLFENAPDIECLPVEVDSKTAQVDYEPSAKQQRADLRAASRQKMLYDIWSDNLFEEKLSQGGIDHFVGGTVALRLRYLPKRGIRYQFLPVQEIFPIPDDDEPEVFHKIHFCSLLDNPNTLWRQTWELIEGKCYLSEATYAVNGLNLIQERYNMEPTGLDFIPVLLVPNMAQSGSMYGTSYLKDLIPLFDRFNRSMSDATDALRFNLFAVTVLLNAPPGAEKKLRLSPNELWNIGGEGVDAKKLESGFNYANALGDFLTRLEHVMHMIGGVPKISPDDIKGFGQITGIGLKMLYADLVSETNASWRVWKSRLQQANEMTLKMLETYESWDEYPYTYKTSDINKEYSNRIIPHLPLPENEMDKINMEVTKLTNDLQSVVGALAELGEKFPERKMAEILQEKERFAPSGAGSVTGFMKMLKDEQEKGNEP
jgi:hypothetical protein